MRLMSLAATRTESEVAARLRDHLGGDPKALPTTRAEFVLTEQANLQLAFDAVLGDAEILGFTPNHEGFGSISLAAIVAGFAMTGPIAFGPVQYADVEVGDGRVVQCVASGVFLAFYDGAPVALVLSRTGEHPMDASKLKLEGGSPAPGAVSSLRRRLLALYGAGIEIDEATLRDLADRSAGVSGAFIKELMRQAWLRGALEDRDTPTADDVRRVLEELLDDRSTLTRRLLGQPGDGPAADTGRAFPAMVNALGAAGLPISLRPPPFDVG